MGRAAATTLALRRETPAVDGKSGAIAAWRGAATSALREARGGGPTGHGGREGRARGT